MAPSPGAAGCCFDRFCLSHPLPCKAIPAQNISDASVRGRSGPGKATAVAGAYLRVSGPEGRLRACTRQLTAAPPTAMKRVVTTPIIKSDGVPRPSAGGGGAFQWWGGAPGWQTGAGFMMNIIMNAVTNLILRSGPVAKRWALLLSERRGRVRPL